jgi:hypothetical protein
MASTVDDTKAYSNGLPREFVTCSSVLEALHLLFDEDGEQIEPFYLSHAFVKVAQRDAMLAASKREGVWGALVDELDRNPYDPPALAERALAVAEWIQRRLGYTNGVGQLHFTLVSDAGSDDVLGDIARQVSC